MFETETQRKRRKFSDLSLKLQSKLSWKSKIMNAIDLLSDTHRWYQTPRCLVQPLSDGNYLIQLISFSFPRIYFSPHFSFRDDDWSLILAKEFLANFVNLATSRGWVEPSKNPSKVSLKLKVLDFSYSLMHYQRCVKNVDGNSDKLFRSSASKLATCCQTFPSVSFRT